jgi:amino acid transporter
VFVGAAVEPDFAVWQSGTFESIAQSLAGWLGTFVLAAAILSSLGMFLPTLAASSRGVWAMGRRNLLGTEHRLMPRIFGNTWPRYGTPVVSLTMLGVTTAIIIALDFEMLVSIDVWLNNVTLLF